MENKITESKLLKALDWAYEKSVNGFGVLDSAEKLGNQFLNDDKNLMEQVDSMIRWQKAKCFTSGFVTGLGGIMTLPLTLPANISSVLFVQVRMIATIAYMAGHDLREDRVKSLVYMCIAGSASTDILKDAGIQVGKGLTKTLIRKIPGEIFFEINKKVGIRLLSKIGQRGTVNFTKLLPVAGGIIGGTIDYFSTASVAKASKNVFIKEES
jgi:uncharacterized protein (DUF697 family)